MLLAQRRGRALFTRLRRATSRSSDVTARSARSKMTRTLSQTSTLTDAAARRSISLRHCAQIDAEPTVNVLPQAG
jgi:hypothetical protein